MSIGRRVLPTAMWVSGAVIGIYLASVGTFALLYAWMVGELRGLLGLVPLAVGVLLLIVTARHLASDLGRAMPLPPGLSLVWSSLVTAFASLLLLGTVFSLLFSDLMLVVSPEWRAEDPPVATTWWLLVEAWLVVGGLLAVVLVVVLILVYPLRLMLVTGMVFGAGAAVLGVLTLPALRSSPLLVLGLVTFTASAIPWWRRRARPGPAGDAGVRKGP